MLEALKTINELKALGLIQDYAIGGAYAVSFYLEPILTYDLDVFVLMDSDEDYHRLYTHFKKRGFRLENVYVLIDDLPVQFLPSYIGPLFHEAVVQARNVRIGEVETKVFTPEHLVAALLLAFRPKDRVIIPSLLRQVDVHLLKSIAERFDSEKTPLHQRLGAVLESVHRGEEQGKGAAF